MATAQRAQDNTSDLAIFARLLRNGKRAMSSGLARYILGLGFDHADQARMADLAARNQDGRLSALEQGELMGFVKAGHLLALLQSKARQALKKGRVS
jgi:hypothetical protein